MAFRTVTKIKDLLVKRAVVSALAQRVPASRHGWRFLLAPILALYFQGALRKAHIIGLLVAVAPVRQVAVSAECVLVRFAIAIPLPALGRQVDQAGIVGPTFYEPDSSASRIACSRCAPASPMS